MRDFAINPVGIASVPSLAMLEVFAELQNFPEQSHEHMHNNAVGVPTPHVPHMVQSIIEGSSCAQARCSASSSCECYTTHSWKRASGNLGQSYLLFFGNRELKITK